MAKLNEVETVKDIIKYLQEKGRNHNKYYHYTTWDSLQKILQNKSFLLTRGNSMRINDQQEAQMKGARDEWNKIYIGSFSFGTSENMAMWGLYGLPWEDAVRIAIPRDKMRQWMNSIAHVNLFSNNTAFPYHGTFKLSLTDVVYISEQKSTQLTHYMTNWTMPEDHPLHGIDTAKEMTGYIKNYAWHYENEARIRVRLDQNTNFEKISISIPDDVVDSITVTTGPCFHRIDDFLYLDLLEKQKITISDFTDLVYYRDLCSMCKNGPFARK